MTPQELHVKGLLPAFPFEGAQCGLRITQQSGLHPAPGMTFREWATLTVLQGMLAGGLLAGGLLADATRARVKSATLGQKVAASPDELKAIADAAINQLRGGAQ